MDPWPKQSASAGFNKLFAKRPKKTKPVSETINLCDDDDGEYNKENSVIPKVDDISKNIEPKVQQKNEEKSKEEIASDEFYVPDMEPTKNDSDKSNATKKETVESKVEIDVDDLDDSREQEEQTSMVKVRYWYTLIFPKLFYLRHFIIFLVLLRRIAINVRICHVLKIWIK